MTKIFNALRVGLPLAIAVTALSGLIYLSVQQMLRQGANDPQIQMAEDAAAALDHGAGTEAVLPKEQVDIAASLSPFVVLYDAQGKPVAGSGMLAGQLPDYPKGALEAAKASGENRVTWQPNAGVRIASVVVPYKDGFVMAGRSLQEVEARVGQAGELVGAGWIATMLAVLGAVTALSLLEGLAGPSKKP